MFHKILNTFTSIIREIYYNKLISVKYLSDKFVFPTQTYNFFLLSINVGSIPTITTNRIY